jgi:co-chaperonin GroES (HSP10)
MNKYNIFRELVLVKKIEDKTVGGIFLPDNAGKQYIRLEVLAVGPDVKEKLESGMIVLAENMFEPMDRTDKSVGVILSKYIIMEDYTYGRN